MNDCFTLVETYKKNRERYGQTIIFAVNVAHAITLAHLFDKAKIPAAFVVSNVKDMATGINISKEQNDQNIEEYRQGRIKVLINVNILTEGIDLPQTQTVFLARPTVSTVLMTQMVGRALRGTAAGGTSKAYIVSFVDRWNEHIAWVNPESLFVKDANEFDDSPARRQRAVTQMIAISKIEEFASIMDDSIDTSALESVPFEKRIPLGMYAFTCLEPGGMDRSYQVMVYDSSEQAYKTFMDSLPDIFESFKAGDEEFPSDELLSAMEKQCRDSIFIDEMIPAYDARSVISVLKYYAQYEAAPQFYTFDDVIRKKLDVTAVAKHIVDERMDVFEEKDYLYRVWNAADENMLRLFFGGRLLYFKKQVDIEKMRLIWTESEPGSNVKIDPRALEDMTLEEIRRVDIELYKKLREGAFEAAMDDEGQYVCPKCGFRNRKKVYFHVDHIDPMDNGGKTVPKNLQVLCASCNRRKGNRV